jgi:hypothetical protein
MARPFWSRPIRISLVSARGTGPGPDAVSSNRLHKRRKSS